MYQSTGVNTHQRDEETAEHIDCSKCRRGVSIYRGALITTKSINTDNNSRSNRCLRSLPHENGSERPLVHSRGAELAYRLKLDSERSAAPATLQKLKTTNISAFEARAGTRFPVCGTSSWEGKVGMFYYTPVRLLGRFRIPLGNADILSASALLRLCS